MKVHLIKDSEVGKDVFSEVVDLLQSINGPIEFLYDINNTIDFTEDDIKENQVLEKKKFEKANDPVAIYSRRVEYANELEFEFRPFKNFTFPLFRKTTKWTTIFKKCTVYRKKDRKSVV